MKIVIRAAEPALTADRHFWRLCGEGPLDRTVRLLAELEPQDAQVRLAVADMADDRYRYRGVRRLKADPARDLVEDSLRRAQDGDSLTILLGDVWWDEEDLAGVLRPLDAPWAAWGRIVGDGGEIFALRLGPAAVAALADGWTAPPDGVPAQWAAFRRLAGLPDDRHGDPDGLLRPVSRWTADLDYRHDWTAWCWAWSQADPDDRPPMREG